MTHTTTRVPWFVVCVLLTYGSVARAQVAAPDKAAAEALFDQGLELMRKGDLVAACLKLEESQGIDHGIGTMLYLAECYEKSGRTASAWALFRQAASEAAAAGQSDRAEIGRRRAAKLEPLLSKLTLSVTQPMAPGLEVTRNGSVVSSSLYGIALPVDPGEQHIEAHAPGYAPWSANVKVDGNAAGAALLVPALSPTVAGAAPAPPTVVESAATPSPPSSVPIAATLDSRPPQHGSLQRTAAFVTGSAGVVALGIGTVFGLRAIAKNDDASQFCANGGARCSDPRGVTLTEDAKSAARLANVFVFGGAALAAAGVVLYVTAPEQDEPSLAIASDGRAVRATLGGVF
jgi:hypothetical protein